MTGVGCDTRDRRALQRIQGCERPKDNSATRNFENETDDCPP